MNEDEVLTQGMLAKSEEFMDKRVELYPKADQMSVTTS
jgi:hypothetical protein